MSDPLPVLRAREGLEEGESKPIEIGRFAPYPVWTTVVAVVRVAQITCIGCFIWYMAALIDAVSPPFTVSTPPLWLMIVSAVISGEDGRMYRRWQTDPAGNLVGRLFASKQCPACGQNIFDHTPPHGYEPPQQQYRSFPLRFCAGCGHDLKQRTAG